MTEVSALSSENIAKAFETLARKVMKRLSVSPQTPRVPQQKLENKKVEHSGGCC